MIDPYLFLTPFLVLGIIALLGFVGCDVVLGLHRPPAPPPPTNFTAVPGDMRVDLTWDASDGATHYTMKRGTTSGVYSKTDTIDAPMTTYPDPGLTNETEYFYALTVTTSAGESQDTAEINATPAPPVPTFKTFVKPNPTLGIPKNALDGWAGMVIQVGASPITVTMLGRLFLPGNGQTHDVKIYDPAAMADVGLVPVDVSTGTAGTFTYASLPNAVTLNPGQVYYVVSYERIGGDYCHVNQDTTVQTETVAMVTSAVTGSSQDVYLLTNDSGHTWGPVDFQYTL